MAVNPHLDLKRTTVDGSVGRRVAETGVPVAGLVRARVGECSWYPNCVSTLSNNPLQAVAPIGYEGTLMQAKPILRAALLAIPGATVVAEDELSIQVEYRSRLFEFVDDVVVAFDDAAKRIHFRAQARLGKWDFGVNRRRMEKIRRAFEERHTARAG